MLVFHSQKSDQPRPILSSPGSEENPDAKADISVLHRCLKMVKHGFADYFSIDSHNGKVARSEHGKLGLHNAPAEEKLTNGRAELDQTNGIPVHRWQ